MNKAELIANIANNTELTKAQAGTALDGLVGVITNALTSGDKVTILGFGTFSTADRAARPGRNPKTGAEIQIPAKTIAKFKPGKDLAGKLNK
jgi:DNA-binding protein HU-beta